MGDNIRRKTLLDITEERREKQRALDFLDSVRGQYIVGQALYIAIETMRDSDNPEHSNISDMEYMMKELFPLYSEIKISSMVNSSQIEIDMELPAPPKETKLPSYANGHREGDKVVLKERSVRKQGVKTSGNFNTREELIDEIVRLYEETDMSLTRIAKEVGVSHVTLLKILKEETSYGDKKS